MNFLKRLRQSNFFIKLKSWEYWPFGIVQFPAIIYYLWLSLRARSFFFFSASNPGIEMGGMFGESKFGILEKIPSRYKAKTVLIKAPATKEVVLTALKQNDFSFPVIFKPDLGERGFMVKRINTESDIAEYLQKMKYDFLVQELVDLPLEFGVFYCRFPWMKNGSVTSVVGKEMLSVTGNGVATLRQLILGFDRAKLQWEKLQISYKDRLDEIIPEGTKIQLVSIGNHALGTKFLDGNYLINDKLSHSFDELALQIDGFYFGRFDLRCGSIDDLYACNVKVMELNGCGAEPAHIYQPGFSFLAATVVLLKHWRNIFIIARANARGGVPYISYREAKMYYRKFKKATQL